MDALRCGVMLPNDEWNPWSINDMAAVVDLRPTVLLVPVYGVGNPYQESRNSDIRRLSVVLRDCVFLYRMMAANPITFGPEIWAAECMARYDAIGVLGDLLPTNEDNIEGGGEDWAAQNAWWMRFAAALQPRVLSRLHLTALSPSGAYKDGWAARKLIEHIFTAVDTHVYPGSESDIEDAAARFTRPIWMTEFNQLNAMTLGYRAAASRVQGMAYFILRGVDDQAQYTLAEPTYSDVRRLAMFPIGFPASSPIPPMSDYTSPNYEKDAGGQPVARPATKGIVLHATFGNVQPPITRAQELRSTYNYFNNPESQLSSHAIVGVGQVVRPVRKEYIAWHGREYNQHHLGLEFVKRFVGDPIPDSDLVLGAMVCAEWCKEYAIPIVWNTVEGLTEHRLIPPGIREGKQDVGLDFDHVAFIAMVERFAGMTDAQKKEVLEHLAVIDGYRQQVKEVADVAQSAVLETAQAAIYERCVAIKVALGIND